MSLSICGLMLRCVGPTLVLCRSLNLERSTHIYIYIGECDRTIKSSLEPLKWYINGERERKKEWERESLYVRENVNAILENS